MEKTYSILIQFGDGNPVSSTIRAKDGCDAQDRALALHPGARSIRITGVIEVHPSPVIKRKVVKKEPRPHPLFTDVSVEQVENIVRTVQEEQLLQCQQLRARGISYRGIAKQLQIGQTTVRRWLTTS